MLDFMEKNKQRSAAITINDGPGHDGAELKDVLPKDNPTRTFVIPWGGNEVNYDDDGKLIVSEEIPGYTFIKFWFNVDSLNESAKEAIKPKGNMFTRLFLGAAGPTGNEWWKDLGYVSFMSEEQELINSGKLSKDTWNNVYPRGKFFNGNAVLPKVWHNFPLVEVKFSGKGKDKVVELGEIVWIKLKPNQLEAFLAAFMGLDDPVLQYRYIIMNNSWTGTDRYSFSRADGLLPDELRDEVDEAAEAVKERIKSLFTTIYEMQHGSVAPTTEDKEQDVKSNENAKRYILSITKYTTWEEFVEAYRITGDPVGDLVSISDFTLDEDE